MNTLALNISLLTLYWLSFFFIGWAIKNVFFSNIKTKNIFLNILVNFFITTVILSILSIALYLMSASSFIYTFAYIILLLFSVVHAVKYLSIININKKYSLTLEIKGIEQWLILALIVFTGLLIVFDYVFTSALGTGLANGTDAYVHIARILDIASHNFTIRDGFLAGVVESRYHFNIVYPLFVPPVQLFDISAAEVYRISLGFFRIIQYVAFASLVGLVISFIDAGKRRSFAIFKNKTLGPLFVASVAFLVRFGYKGAFLHVATYPNAIVAVWTTILIIGLVFFIDGQSDLKRKSSAILCLAASFLIAGSHPTYALMAAVYIFIVLSISFIIAIVNKNKHKKDIQKTAWLGIFIFIILMIAPVVSAIFPNHMTQESFVYGNFTTTMLLGARILPFHLPSNILLLFLCALIVAGYWFIFKGLVKNKRTNVLIILVPIICFSFLTIHNPIFMMIVIEKLPLWLLSRFSGFNILSGVAIAVSIIIIVRKIINTNKIKKMKNVYLMLLLSSVVLFGVLGEFNNLKLVKKDFDVTYIKMLRGLGYDFHKYIEKDSLVIANEGDSYVLSAALPVKVISIHSTHATPSADAKSRSSCQDALLSSYYTNRLLKTTNADYILINTWDDDRENRKKNLDSRSEIAFVTRNQEFILYKVQKDKLIETIDKESSCYQYRKVEN